jgi:hypothetical protein
MLIKEDTNCSTFCVYVREPWEYHRKWRNSKLIRCRSKGLQVCCTEPARFVRHHFQTVKTSPLFLCHFYTVLCRIGFSPFLSGMIRWNLHLLSSGILRASSEYLARSCSSERRKQEQLRNLASAWLHCKTTPASLAMFDQRICWHKCPIFACPEKLRNIWNRLRWPPFHIRYQQLRTAVDITCLTLIQVVLISKFSWVPACEIWWYLKYSLIFFNIFSSQFIRYTYSSLAYLTLTGSM